MFTFDHGQGWPYWWLGKGITSAAWDFLRIQAGSKRRNPSGNDFLLKTKNKDSANDFLEHPGPLGCQSPKELIKVVKHFLKLAVSGREDGWLS
jgi:hypothetical protein